MASHNKLGIYGEELAKTWLTNNGYEVLHRNWRYSHWEVDIIASKNKVLHFIEVKTRSSKAFGNPEESVSDAKINNLVNAADQFLHLFPAWKRVQFDILSITVQCRKAAAFFFIEDVFL